MGKEIHPHSAIGEGWYVRDMRLKEAKKYR